MANGECPANYMKLRVVHAGNAINVFPATDSKETAS